MIFGRVSSGKEAIVQLAILGSNKLPLSVRGIIDTGYTGALTLPVEQIEQMGLTWYMKEKGVLGDGNKCEFNVYEASVIWDAQIIDIDVRESASAPLIGMTLLEGFELKVQGFPGGLVSITALSSAENN